jgi:CRISPR-associated protein Cmr5
METLENARATDAWQKCEGYRAKHVNVAKSLPALLMNSGLMQTLAFCHQKGDEYEIVAAQLRQWLGSRFLKAGEAPDFEPFMENLLKADAASYQRMTTEAFAWLKWLRQLAAARVRAG